MSVRVCAYAQVTRAKLHRTVNAMASVTDIITEITQISELHKRRGRCKLITGLIDSVALKIGVVVYWDAGTALQFATVVDAAGFPDDLATLLHDAGDARASTHIASSTGARQPASGAPPRDQTLRHL